MTCVGGIAALGGVGLRITPLAGYRSNSCGLLLQGFSTFEAKNKQTLDTNKKQEILKNKNEKVFYI